MTKKQVCAIMYGEMMAEDGEGLILPPHLKDRMPDLMFEVLHLEEELKQHPEEREEEFTGGSKAFQAALDYHLKERHLN